MKKKTSLLIILLALCAAFLLLLSLFIALRSRRMDQHLDRLSQEMESAARQLQGILDEDFSVNGSSESDDDTQTQETLAPAEEIGLLSRVGNLVRDQSEGDEPASYASCYRAADYPVPEHQVIFVGDSRTVGLGKAEKAAGDTCIYIGESGEGYRWFSEEGIRRMDEAIRSYPAAPVVFNLGVNDCDAIDAYLETYDEILNAYPDTAFYFLSVNPVTDESLQVTDQDITAFNQALRRAYPDRYIDTYTWMTTYGFVSVDGIHYTEEQYCAIHDYAVRAILSLPQPKVGLTEAATEAESQESATGR